MKIVSVVFIIFGVQASANTNCKKLVTDLQEMTQAQTQILKSANSNHETAASTLEEYSELIPSALEPSSAVKLAEKMQNTAQEFRSRGQKGQKLALKLSAATDELVQQLLVCLK